MSVIYIYLLSIYLPTYLSFFLSFFLFFFLSINQWINHSQWLHISRGKFLYQQCQGLKLLDLCNASSIMDREICLVQDFWLSPPNLLPFTLRYGSKWLKSNIDYWFWMLSCQCLHFSLMQESRWIDASQVGPTYQSNETFKGHLIAHSAQFWSFLPAQSLSFDWMMWWIKSILKKHVRNLWHNNWKICTVRIHPWVGQPKQYVQIWTHRITTYLETAGRCIVHCKGQHLSEILKILLPSRLSSLRVIFRHIFNIKQCEKQCRTYKRIWKALWSSVWVW